VRGRLGEREGEVRADLLLRNLLRFGLQSGGEGRGVAVSLPHGQAGGLFASGLAGCVVRVRQLSRGEEHGLTKLVIPHRVKQGQDVGSLCACNTGCSQSARRCSRDLLPPRSPSPRPTPRREEEDGGGGRGAEDGTDGRERGRRVAFCARRSRSGRSVGARGAEVRMRAGKCGWLGVGDNIGPALLRRRGRAHA